MPYSPVLPGKLTSSRPATSSGEPASLTGLKGYPHVCQSAHVPVHLQTEGLPMRTRAKGNLSSTHSHDDVYIMLGLREMRPTAEKLRLFLLPAKIRGFLDSHATHRACRHREIQFALFVARASRPVEDNLDLYTRIQLPAHGTPGGQEGRTEKPAEPPHFAAGWCSGSRFFPAAEITARRPAGTGVGCQH